MGALRVMRFALIVVLGLSAHHHGVLVFLNLGVVVLLELEQRSGKLGPTVAIGSGVMRQLANNPARVDELGAVADV